MVENGPKVVKMGKYLNKVRYYGKKIYVLF